MSNEARQPNAIDVNVGHRVRMRRLELSMSQGKLAETLGLTFQQIQKYEKGANRISSSRLDEIAKALSVPVAFFFPESAHSSAEAMQVQELLSTANSLRLQRAFAAIQDPDVKRSLLILAETLASQTNPSFEPG
jgi:transcriptional regulator with XRE-family HTH domain